MLSPLNRRCFRFQYSITSSPVDATSTSTGTPKPAEPVKKPAGSISGQRNSLAGVCGKKIANQVANIAEGAPTQPGEFPWHAGIWHKTVGEYGNP